jgi:PAP2 superfamily
MFGAHWQVRSFPPQQESRPTHAPVWAAVPSFPGASGEAAREAALAWRLFEANWLLIAAMGLAFVLGLGATGFSVTPGSIAMTLAIAGTYAGFAYYNAKAPHRGDPQVVFVLGATAHMVLITALMTPLTYVAAAMNFPLQDAALDAADRALGLDWRSAVAFVNAHPLLGTFLSIGYAMIRWPIFIIPVALAAAGAYRRLQEFTLAFGLALAVTTFFSALVPAYGFYHLLGPALADYPNINPVAYFLSSHELPQVRDGTLRTLDLINLSGLVTFPSFHAASAVLYAWALWPVRWMRWVGLVSNGAMLAATPVDGGHYFIDVMAGVAVALAAIRLARYVSRRIEAGMTAKSAPLPASLPEPARFAGISAAERP